MREKIRHTLPGCVKEVGHRHSTQRHGKTGGEGTIFDASIALLFGNRAPRVLPEGIVEERKDRK